LGGKAIELKIGPGNRVLQSEDTLIAAVEQNLSEMISQKITPITENVDTALVNLNILIRKFQSMSNSIDATLVNLRNTSSTLNTTLEQNQSAIAGISSNLRTLSASLNDPQTGVKPMLGKFNSFADTLSNMQLARTVERTNQSINNLNQMLTRINQGDGTIGKLAKNDSLYNNLNQFASDLDALVVDLKANPKRYVTISVFGRRDKKDSKPKEEKQEKTERQEVSRK
jgi:phospholipid/cholesterol/gamma-HCH transport system substrate-binding protein